MPVGALLAWSGQFDVSVGLVRAGESRHYWQNPSAEPPGTNSTHTPNAPSVPLLANFNAHACVPPYREGGWGGPGRAGRAWQGHGGQGWRGRSQPGRATRARKSPTVVPSCQPSKNTPLPQNNTPSPKTIRTPPSTGAPTPLDPHTVQQISRHESNRAGLQTVTSRQAPPGKRVSQKKREGLARTHTLHDPPPPPHTRTHTRPPQASRDIRC